MPDVYPMRLSRHVKMEMQTLPELELDDAVRAMLPGRIHHWDIVGQLTPEQRYDIAVRIVKYQYIFFVAAREFVRLAPASHFTPTAYNLVEFRRRMHVGAIRPISRDRRPASVAYMHCLDLLFMTARFHNMTTAAWPTMSISNLHAEYMLANHADDHALVARWYNGSSSTFGQTVPRNLNIFPQNGMDRILLPPAVVVEQTALLDPAADADLVRDVLAANGRLEAVLSYHGPTIVALGGPIRTRAECIIALVSALALRVTLARMQMTGYNETLFPRPMALLTDQLLQRMVAAEDARIETSFGAEWRPDLVHRINALQRRYDLNDNLASMITGRE